MPQFAVNAHRFDPYRNFKFRVKWDGQYVAGLSTCSALSRNTEVVDWREGGDPSTGRKLPGATFEIDLPGRLIETGERVTAT